MSIIIVFEVFTLQLWLQEALNLDSFAHEVDERAVVDSLERRRTADRINRHRAKFPWLQISALSMAVAVILLLAAVLGIQVQGISEAFTLGPVVVLSITYIGVAVGIRTQGVRILRQAVKRLS
ncbi:hypothetical protein [Acrocarpospora sp. B8E8]|uniref:hypothetical protein n=1 Tax=Acrocarpospora sp. B8E8 TaxID=3153572 RepID=UPI00325FC552